MAIIVIKNLDFAFIGEDILKDVNLTIRQEDFVALTYHRSQRWW